MATDYTYDPEHGQKEPGALVRVIDTGTGETKEISPFPQADDRNGAPLALRDSTFAKVSNKPLLVKQSKVLRKNVADDEIDIKPGGEVYYSHIHVRRRLNDAVGPGGWALRPLATPCVDPQKGDMYREYALMVLGRVVATAFGSAKYHESNRNMDFADVAEAVKSNALTRCSKDLGIAPEVWDRHWCEQWRNRNAVHVWVRVKKRGTRGANQEYESKDQWRRIDAPPFKGEIEPVADSPNQDKWRAQFETHMRIVQAEHKASREVADKLREAMNTAKQSTSEAERVMKETRANAAPQHSEPATRTSQAAQAPVSTQPRPDERPYLIRECKVVKRDPKFTLHRITMMDGQHWYTFSTTVYAAMQQHFAKRDQISITKYSTQKSNNETFRHIEKDGWQVLMPGKLAPREPGEEG
jgi:hypothetical protein